MHMTRGALKKENPSLWLELLGNSSCCEYVKSHICKLWEVRMRTPLEAIIHPAMVEM